MVGSPGGVQNFFWATFGVFKKCFLGSGHQILQDTKKTLENKKSPFCNYPSQVWPQN